MHPRPTQVVLTRDEYDGLIRRFDHLEGRVASLTQDVATLTTQNQTLTREVATLRSENQALRLDLANSQYNYNQSQIQNQQLQEQNTQLIQRNDRLRADNQLLQTANADLQANLVTITKANQDLRNDLTEARNSNWIYRTIAYVSSAAVGAAIAETGFVCSVGYAALKYVDLTLLGSWLQGIGLGAVGFQILSFLGWTVVVAAAGWCLWTAGKWAWNKLHPPAPLVLPAAAYCRLHRLSTSCTASPSRVHDQHQYRYPRSFSFHL